MSASPEHHPSETASPIPDKDQFSFWAKKLGIANLKENRVKWNNDWEKALKSFKNAREVVETMKDLFKGDDGSDSDAQPSDQSLMEELQDVVRKRQTAAKGFVKEILDLGHLDTIWILLDVSEKKRHVLQGLQNASNISFLLGQDSRAFCPEITVTQMISRNGQGFVDFINTYHELAQATDPEKLYFFPSPWWEEAANDAANPMSAKARFTYEFATMLRNDFLASFVMGILLSISGDISKGHKGMKPVINFMENTDGFFAQSIADAKAGLREKPLIRCDNCTKTPEEIGPDTHFMACSTCKSKLNFIVHYCSQECQKADWKTHKPNCGKKRVSKGLPGTAGDSLWMHKDPSVEFVRDLPTNAGGKEMIRAIGIAPAQYTRPQALELQVSMLEKDKDADYFLFNTKGEPVRFVIDDLWTKFNFRTIRRTAMAQADNHGSEALGEYMIKVMGKSPGLSRERILTQLVAEYGIEARRKVAVFEKRAAEAGRGLTFIESYSENIRKVMPRFG
ncbi:hypothetical protein HYDPIDRAFT_117259 [Hydnomerulius pinastri MD-312]|uniref:MYND-type domain-containing protein n=1 Tax=Hydnomerulius pinastri MD-312 TaxID=994086 RepID=A0A0C9VRB5_9AGAM|nr:hypothetical protein HYDPIDRAFT_117259 [Hydnomerulius pinastri MD-312]